MNCTGRSPAASQTGVGARGRWRTRRRVLIRHALREPAQPALHHGERVVLAPVPAGGRLPAAHVRAEEPHQRVRLARLVPRQLQARGTLRFAAHFRVVLGFQEFLVCAAVPAGGGLPAAHVRAEEPHQRVRLARLVPRQLQARGTLRFAAHFRVVLGFQEFLVCAAVPAGGGLPAAHVRAEQPHQRVRLPWLVPRQLQARLWVLQGLRARAKGWTSGFLTRHAHGCASTCTCVSP